MVSVHITGEQKLARVARVLEGHAAKKTIQRRLSKTIRDQSDHITKEQRAALAAGLPHRGGLAATVAGEGKFTIRTTLAGKTATVTIIDSWKGHDMKSIDRGRIRHPFWGRWVEGGRHTQRIKPDMLTQPVMRNQRKLRFGIVRTLDALAAEIAKET